MHGFRTRRTRFSHSTSLYVFGRMSTNSTTRTGISASGVFTCATFRFSTWNPFRIYKFRHSVTQAIRISFRLAARFSHLACIINYQLIRMVLGCKSRERRASTRVSSSGVWACTTFLLWRYKVHKLACIFAWFLPALVLWIEIWLQVQEYWR